MDILQEDSLGLPEVDSLQEDSLEEGEDSLEEGEDTQVLLEEGSRLGDMRLQEEHRQLEDIPQVGIPQEVQDSQQEHQDKELDRLEADKHLEVDKHLEADSQGRHLGAVGSLDSLLEEPQLQGPSRPILPPSPEFQDGVPCCSASVRQRHPVLEMTLTPKSRKRESGFSYQVISAGIIFVVY